MTAVPTLAEWLRERPFCLALSAGFFGFFAHTGVVQALEEAGIEPARVAGASAGALVAGLWAAGMPAERLGHEFAALRREHFWDPWPGLGLLRGKKFRAKLESLLPVARIESTHRPCRIVVHDILGHRPVALASGHLATAVHASCAMPPLFQPVWIEGRLYTDGGASDRPALSAVAPGERVLVHHLVNRSPFHAPSNRSAGRLAERAGQVTLAIHGVPRSGPFKLPEGPKALAAARRATAEALARRIEGGVVEIGA